MARLIISSNVLASQLGLNKIFQRHSSFILKKTDAFATDDCKQWHPSPHYNKVMHQRDGVHFQKLLTTRWTVFSRQFSSSSVGGLSGLNSGVLQKALGIGKLQQPGGANALIPAAHDSGTLYEFGPMLVTLWTCILGGNLIGLAGYSIGPTVHLAIVFPTALALWGSIIMSSIQYRPNEFFAHLVPPGSPLVLAPFLCVIEAASIVIRPITLSVRLVANLSAGHLILGLIGGGVVAGGMMTQITSLGVSTLYTGFEVFVACIQTYIFCNLVSLYSEEHS